MHEREHVEAGFGDLVNEIRRGLPDNPGGMSADEFSRLCENIARAVSQAVQAHESKLHRQPPEFGEPMGENS